MKKAILLFGILIAANVLVAQDQLPQERALKIEEFKTRLELTDEQSEQLKLLREKYHPEMKAVRDDDAKSKSEKMRAAADIVEKRENEVAAILTDKQQDELKVIKKELKEDRRKRKKNRQMKRGRN